MGKWNAPFGKILRHLRKRVQSLPARQHEYVADNQSHDQRSCPEEIGGDPRRQYDKKICDESHLAPLGGKSSTRRLRCGRRFVTARAVKFEQPGLRVPYREGGINCAFCLACEADCPRTRRTRNSRNGL